MVKIVLASHGPMADAMVQSSHMLFGESANVSSVCLLVEDSINDFAKRLKEAIEPDQEVLLLVDIPGGTPSNQGLALLSEYPNLRVVSGMNLMMLLECLIRSESTSVDELKEIAIKSSRDSIHEMEIVNIEADEMDELFD